ncbi:MAG: hypothetical protein AAF543_01750 [Pseudomonadota bacterium]
MMIGKSELFDPDGMEGFYCPFSIEFRGQKKCCYSGGADAVQALQLAVNMIGANLEHLARLHDLSMSWERLEGTGSPQIDSLQ